MDKKRGHTRVVAVGGGTGLANLLRVLKELTYELTAVVAMTDNGGSSGMLRADFGMQPPGDVRNCLAALSGQEQGLETLLAYRFPADSTLSGHNVGNILLAALMQAEGLDLAAAVERLSAILAVQGRVIPCTMDSVSLGAVLEDGSLIHGEVEIAADCRAVRDVFLLPENARPSAEALRAIAAADYILLGPGSIYSSVISNLLVPGLARAIGESRARVYYIGNMATEPGEMADDDLACYLAAIERCYRRQAGDAGRLVDVVIANDGVYCEPALAVLRQTGSRPVRFDRAALLAAGAEVITADFVDAENFWQHNRGKLREVLRRELGMQV